MQTISEKLVEAASLLLKLNLLKGFGLLFFFFGAIFEMPVQQRKGLRALSVGRVMFALLLAVVFVIRWVFSMTRPIGPYPFPVSLT